MTTVQILVLLIILASLILYCTSWFRLEVSALIVLGVTALVGTYSELLAPEDIFAGFSNPATVTIACMFVLSATVMQSGVMVHLSRLIERAAQQSELRLLLLLAITVPPLSAFVNNTPVVVLMIPAVLKVCERTGIPAARVLIPLSFFSIVGGACTLVGTSTNLLIASLAGDALQETPLHMFSFLPIGLVNVAIAVATIILLRRKLLPSRTHPAGFLPEDGGAETYMTEVRLHDNSPLIGTVLRRGEFDRNDLRVMAVIRDEILVSPPPWNEPLRDNDSLLLRATPERIMEMIAAKQAESLPGMQHPRDDIRATQMRIAELIPLPNSPIVGRLIVRANLYNDWDLHTLAIQRRQHHFREGLQNMRISVGDILLVQGHESDIEVACRQLDMVQIQGKKIGTVAPLRDAAVPLLIVIAAVLLATFQVLPIMVSALLGVIAAVLANRITFRDAMASMDRSVLFLLAASIPLAQLFETSGLARLLADGMLGLFAGTAPGVVMAAVYVATLMLTQVVTNNATAAVMAPVAIQMSHAMGVSPLPFVMAVAYGASCSFITHIGYQTNTIVYSAGGYSIRDFARIGLPLSILAGAATIWAIPRVFPF